MLREEKEDVEDTDMLNGSKMFLHPDGSMSVVHAGGGV